jgi:predicted nucleic acid-binding protein
MAKEKIICDTDVIIDYFDHKQNRHTETLAIIENSIGLENVLVSSITKMELLLGAGNKEGLNAIQKRLNRFGIILTTPQINLKAIDLVLEYNLSHGLTIPDALIAATALEMGLKLFTYNIRDFKFIDKLDLYQKQ